MKVLVCDDRESDCKVAVESINGLEISDLQVDPLYSSTLRQVLEQFFEGIENDTGQAPVQSKFDDYDIVFLDNNLSALKITGARLTAEAVAGYIRAYSTAKYIVSINKNPEVDFDLRYLVGDYSTVADLALNTPHLSNKGLWTGDPAHADNGFKPWYWPMLLSESSRRSEQIKFVRKNLDKPVFEALGFPNEVANYISRHAIGTLSPEASYQAAGDGKPTEGLPVSKTTFLQFFNARSRSLSNKEERKVIMDPDSESKPAENSLEIVSRVVAADIDLWFRRDLVAPQDAIVDLPHLLLRVPFLLGKRSADPSAWNQVIAESEPPYGLDSSMFEEYLRVAELAYSMWSPRPTFYWPQIREKQYSRRSPSEETTQSADVVFCEDLSKFTYREPEDLTTPRPFQAEFEGSWTRRYVDRLNGIRYVPRSRFAL